MGVSRRYSKRLNRNKKYKSSKHKSSKHKGKLTKIIRRRKNKKTGGMRSLERLGRLGRKIKLKLKFKNSMKQPNNQTGYSFNNSISNTQSEENNTDWVVYTGTNHQPIPNYNPQNTINSFSLEQLAANGNSLTRQKQNQQKREEMEERQKRQAKQEARSLLVKHAQNYSTPAQRKAREININTNVNTRFGLQHVT
jgi:hypothetical protein